MALFSYNDFKSELTPGKIAAKVVVTMLVALLIYSYEGISKIILNIYKHISQNLYDNLLESVAAGPKDNALYLSGFVITFLIMLLGYATYSMRARISRLMTKLSPKPENTKPINLEVQLKSLKKLKKLTAVQIVLWIFTFCLFLLVYSLETSKVDIRRAFERKISIISPYVELSQKEKLISDFSLMKKEHDYTKINTTLDSILTANSLYP